MNNETDNTIPLPDAIRAYRDRPSMEAELRELREKCARYEKALRELVEVTAHASGGWQGVALIARTALEAGQAKEGE